MAQAQPNGPGYLLPLDAPHATLENVGGKGVNLAFLARHALNVPPGFLVTTAAYRHFVDEHELASWLDRELAATDTEDPAALNALSARIRDAFRRHDLPAPLAQAIRAAYAQLGDAQLGDAELGAPPVAVRSSATAEDLPDMSFAGQQDTFLNVQGEDALLEAVRECWSSLWTARAIGYRTRNGVDHSNVALAVIVQQMVPSAAAGVLFTANPLTGKRDETVIDATLGLGEALVSGQVEPDHYVVETASARILHRHIGAKATIIEGKATGGTVTRRVEADPAGQTQQPALRDAAIQELTRLGAQVAELYGAPQDIEWAWADEQLYLLQSRPITALYPLPASGGIAAETDEDTGLRVYLSFGAIQGVLAPFTPLGQDTIKTVMAGGARLLGFAHVTPENQGILYSAGERLWVDLTGVIRTHLGRGFVRKALPIADPAGGAGLERLFDEPQLAPVASGPQPATIRQILPTARRVVKTLLWSLARPDASRTLAQETADAAVAQLEQEAARVDSLRAWVEFQRGLSLRIFPLIIPLFVPRVATAYIALGLLGKLASALAADAEGRDAEGRDAEGRDAEEQDAEEQDAERVEEIGAGPSVMELTRGLPHNVTTEMDLALWQLTQTIRRDAAAREAMQTQDTAALATAYLAGELPPAAQRGLDEFMARYGMRGLAEIDVGRVRWREQPASIIRTVQSYLQVEQPEMAPDAVFERGAEHAAAAVEALSAAAARRWGASGAWLVQWLARRVRALAGLRETPKLTMIRLLDIGRSTLLENAATWLANTPDAATLRGEDLFYLHLNELYALALGAPGDWQQLVQNRRARWTRENRRKLVPRLLLSDGTTIYDGMPSTGAAGAASAADGAHTLTGQPVAAGVVEGKVRVVLDPDQANLQLGEIMVCPGTDPAWTPLFLVAGGLVMEVGGLMTHGSVVAREYGIPAVVGVDRATTRLQTGERIRVDGSQGRIVRLDIAEAEPPEADTPVTDAQSAA